MIAALVLLALGQALLPPPAAAFGADEAVDEIVVTAIDKKKCRVRFADRDMNDAELKRRSDEWAAGRPLRVIARASTDIKCLAKIAFKLADRGVTRIQFVEPKDVASLVLAPRP